MKRKIFILALVHFVFAALHGQSVNKISDPVEWINPLMGTDSKPDLSNGNTYPSIAVPWGMNFWTPQTGKMGDGWAYTYKADKINGFKQTHQPSPWMNDRHIYFFMPCCFKLNNGAGMISSIFQRIFCQYVFMPAMSNRKSLIKINDEVVFKISSYSPAVLC